MLDLRQILTDQKLPAEILKAAEIGDLAWFKLCLSNNEAKERGDLSVRKYCSISESKV